MNHASWYAYLCAIFSLWVWVGTSAHFLIHRIWQSLWDSTSDMRLQRSCLLSHSLASFLWGKPDVLLWVALQKAHGARNQRRSLALGGEKLNPASHHVSENAIPSSPQLSLLIRQTAAPADKQWLQPVRETLRQRYSAKPHLDSWLTEMARW